MEEDLKNALTSTILMGIVDAFVLYKRIIGEPIFQPLFEFFLFYFPLILLLLYLIKISI